MSETPWHIEAMLREKHQQDVSLPTRNAFNDWKLAKYDAKFANLDIAVENLLERDWNSMYYFRIRNVETEEIIPGELFT